MRTIIVLLYKKGNCRNNKNFNEKIIKSVNSKVCVICNTEKVMTLLTTSVENVNSVILKEF